LSKKYLVFVLKSIDLFYLGDMNRRLNKFYFLIIVLLGTMYSYAAKGGSPGPPAPTAKKKTPPPPPELFIDENIFILFIIALLFGIFIIYRYNVKTKSLTKSLK